MNLRRKRMMLMDGQWYGYLRTASGNPLTLQNAKRLRKLTIYGNAVQDGTPSPDAPVEVQLCGDRTGNLLSIIDANPNTIPVKSYSNGIIEVIGEASLSGGRTNRLSDYITLETNQTYTMVSYLVAGQTDSNLYVCLSRREGGTIYEGIEMSAEKRFITIAPDENVELYLGINVTQGNRNSTLRVAIYKGSYTADTLPAYEPYGYKVSGRVDGLNLLDVSGEVSTFEAGATWTINNDGSITVSGTPTDYSSVSFPRIKAKPNTIYTLSTNIEIPNVVGVIIFYDADNTMIAASTGTNSSSMFQAVSPEGTTSVAASFKRNINNVAIPETTFYPMLVQGAYTAETMPPYEPYQPPQDFAVYLPEQIAKVGDVADEVVVDMERKTAELRKNVGSVVVSDRLASSATGSKGDDIALFYKLFPDRFIANSETVSVMSDKLVGLSLSDYKNSSSKDMLSLAGNNTTTAVFMKLSKTDIGGDTAESANTWIADNRITVYYVLATPVTTDITSLQQWDAMPQVSGTVTLTLSAEVDPSGAEAVYYSKERGE